MPLLPMPLLPEPLVPGEPMPELLPEVEPLPVLPLPLPMPEPLELPELPEPMPDEPLELPEEPGVVVLDASSRFVQAPNANTATKATAATGFKKDVCIVFPYKKLADKVSLKYF